MVLRYCVPGSTPRHFRAFWAAAWAYTKCIRLATLVGAKWGTALHFGIKVWYTIGIKGPIFGAQKGQITVCLYSVVLRCNWLAVPHLQKTPKTGTLVTNVYNLVL